MSHLQGSLLVALEAFRDHAAMVTGMKQILIDQGWSELGAEHIVIAAIARSTK